VIPALPLIVIRPFLPESPTWKGRRDAGLLERPRLRELFSAELRQTTIATTLLVALGYAVAFGALQQTPTIVPALPEVSGLDRQAQRDAVSAVNACQEIGGLVGRFVLAFLAVRIASRRILLRSFQIPALLVIPLVFLFPAKSDVDFLKAGIFVAGLFTVAQFSFWGNYLPRVYPTHLRGTGESFAANVGGRMLGTFAALVTSQLSLAMPGATAGEQRANAAALVSAVAIVAAIVITFWLPEPKQEELPD
jgi:sugar phosphate permease